MVNRSTLRTPSADSKPLLAVVGATDVAVERIRGLMETGKVQEGLHRLPASAVAHAIDVAARAGTGYEHLAERGRTRVDHMRAQESTQQTLAKGRDALRRTQAVVADGRRGVKSAWCVVRGALQTVSRTSGASQGASAGDEGAAPEPECVLVEGELLDSPPPAPTGEGETGCAEGQGCACRDEDDAASEGREPSE